MTENESRQNFYSKGYYKGFTPEPRFIKVANILAKLKGENFLDIGCGDGDITLFLKDKMNATNAYGIEISEEATVEAKKKGVIAFKMDVDNCDLPFEDNFFDAIYCGEIIEHVFDTDHLLKETKRVLKSGGVCIFTTPNLAGWSSRFALLFGYQPYPMAASPVHESAGKLLTKSPEGQWGHIRVMTLRAFKELVNFYGFRVIKIEGCSVTIKSCGPRLLLNSVKAVDKIMSRFPSFSTRIIAILEKE